MASELSNHYKQQLHSGNIDYDVDVFKLVLMASGFVFNKDTHATWADASASELAAGNGYTTGGNTLTGVSVTEDDTNDRSRVTWTGGNSWTASGGSIGPSPGAIIYDDTSVDDTIVGFIDFGGNQTATDGGTFAVDNPAPTVDLT